MFRVIGRVRDAGINVIGNYIFGLPEDDLDTMRATLDLALDLNCEFANFYSAMAYPGSPLYALAVRQGVPLPRRWTGYSQHARDTLPLPTRHVTGARCSASATRRSSATTPTRATWTWWSAASARKPSSTSGR